jgi:adenosylcobinamide-GDP ribazoletransferase
VVLTAVRGALAFLTRLPVGGGAAGWAAFRAAPAAFPLAAYPIGALVALPVALAGLLPGAAPGLAPTAAAASLAAVYAVTGVAHADGLADLGDAAAVHGDADARRAVLKDSQAGVGAVLAVALAVAGLALGLYALVAVVLPAAGLRRAVGLLVASEVGAKLGMAAIACLGDAAFEGVGAELTSRAGRRQLLGPLVAALPALLFTAPGPATLAAPAAVAAALAVALACLRWADRRLGGVNGDVFGAANELGRVAGLHAGAVVLLLA